jgi:hypothetical protein
VHTRSNKKLLTALLRRYGGHPYERGDMIDFKTVDPTRPLAENMAALGYNRNELVRARAGGRGGGRAGVGLSSRTAQRRAPLDTAKGPCLASRFPGSRGNAWCAIQAKRVGCTHEGDEAAPSRTPLPAQPPELSPLAFPELVGNPNSALADFDNQIR